MGRSGSVEVSLKPAPQGVGLAVGDIAKSILRLAGITDAWGFTKGHTKPTGNYALAAFDALRRTAGVKVREEQTDRLKIRQGAEQVYVHKLAAPAPAEGAAAAAPALPEEVEVEGEDLVEEPKEEPAHEGEPKDEVTQP